MARGVGALNVSVNADTAKAVRGIGDLRNELGKVPRVSRDAASAGSILSSKMIAMTGPAAVAASALAGLAFGVNETRKAFGRLDELNHLSSTLGIDPKAISSLGLAAKMNGSDFATMNTGLEQMNRRVAEASVGAGKAGAALTALGIDARQLNDLPVDQKFATIADAFGNLKNPAEEARIAFRLFGSQGLDLVETLRLGSAGLGEYAAEAARLGIALSKSDLDKVSEAQDAMDRLGLAIEGAGNSLAVTVAPVLTSIINGFMSLEQSDTFRNIVKYTTPLGYLAVKLREAREDTPLAADPGLEKRAKFDAEALERAEKLTEEYEKQFAAAERQRKVAQSSETTVAYWEGIEKFGVVRGQQLAEEKRLAAEAIEDEAKRKAAAAEAEQARKEKLREEDRKRQEAERKHLENVRKDAESIQKLRNRVADFGKTALEKDRDELLRTLEDPKQRQEAMFHFGTLERMEKGKTDLDRLRDERKTLAGREGAGMMDARTSEGWAALRANVNNAPELARLDKLIALQEKANDHLAKVEVHEVFHL